MDEILANTVVDRSTLIAVLHWLNASHLQLGECARDLLIYGGTAGVAIGLKSESFYVAQNWVWRGILVSIAAAYLSAEYVPLSLEIVAFPTYAGLLLSVSLSIGSVVGALLASRKHFGAAVIQEGDGLLFGAVRGAYRLHLIQSAI